MYSGQGEGEEALRGVHILIHQTMGVHIKVFLILFATSASVRRTGATMLYKKGNVCGRHFCQGQSGCLLIPLMRSIWRLRSYVTLQILQGIMIPRVRGYYDIWDVGTANGPINRFDTQTRMKMKSALARMYSAGYISSWRHCTTQLLQEG